MGSATASHIVNPHSTSGGSEPGLWAKPAVHRWGAAPARVLAEPFEQRGNGNGPLWGSLDDRCSLHGGGQEVTRGVCAWRWPFRLRAATTVTLILPLELNQS